MQEEQESRPQRAPGSVSPTRAGAGLTRRRFVLGAGSTVVLGGTGLLADGCGGSVSPARVLRTTSLLPPRPSGPVSLEETLSQRRSMREFTSRPLTMQEISQLLWAAQGITASWGGRTSPSAGGLYPLELYVVTRAEYGHYLPREHSLELLAEGDLRGVVAAAARGQSAVRTAPLIVLIAAVYGRTTRTYGSQGTRFVALEAGHAAENLLLQAVALGLGAVPIGSLDDERMADSLRLPGEHTPLYLVAVGHPRSQAAA